MFVTGGLLKAGLLGGVALARAVNDKRLAKEMARTIKKAINEYPASLTV
ncbi:MAG: hypothetical protein ABGW96_04295 [Methylophilaceae bacterium]